MSDRKRSNKRFAVDVIDAVEKYLDAQLAIMARSCGGAPKLTKAKRDRVVRDLARVLQDARDSAERRIFRHGGC